MRTQPYKTTLTIETKVGETKAIDILGEWVRRHVRDADHQAKHLGGALDLGTVRVEALGLVGDVWAWRLRADIVVTGEGP